jgi:hypothetical protein
LPSGRYKRRFPTNDARLVALAPWVDHNNHNRIHMALHDLTAMSVMVSNVSGNHT